MAQASGEIKYTIGFDVQKQSLNDLKTSLESIRKMTYGDFMKINNSSIKEARKDFAEVQKTIKVVETAMESAFNKKLNTVNIDAFNNKLKQNQLTLQQVYTTFSKAGARGQASFRNLTTSLLSVNTELRKSHEFLDKVANTFANTIKWTISSSIVNNFSRSIQEAWGYTKALDSSLNDIRIVTGNSANEMARFAVQANETAKALGKTTTDYTNAALIYAQQGLSDEEIAKRTEITLKTANVTGQSTDKVSEELTAVWNGYKVNADEAEVYVDRLAAVAATTASDLQELSTAMSKVASAANAMGVSEEQLAAQLSTIISATRQAPESVGTALRTVYARISDIQAGIDEEGVSLGNYSGKMAELGFNVLDMNGKLRDMGEVMEEIGNRWGDLTREQQISLAQTMAGQRQYSNLIALFDNFEQYNKSLTTAQNAAGTLQEQQDIYMDSMAAHLKQLKASTEGIFNSLFDEQATDGIKDLVDGLSGVADLIAQVTQGLGGGIGVLQTLGTVALQVFQTQLARGLAISIENFQAAERNAQALKQSIQAAADISAQLEKRRSADPFNANLDYTKDIVDKYQFFGDNSRLLTQEEFSQAQQLLQKQGDISGKILINDEDIEAIERARIAVYQLMESEQRFSSSDEVEKHLQKQKVSLFGVQKELKNFASTWKDFSNALEQGNTNDINTYFGQLQTILTNLKTKVGAGGIFQDIPDAAKKAIYAAQLEFNKIDLSGSADSIKEQTLAIFGNLSAGVKTSIAEINAEMEVIKGTDQAKYKELLQRRQELEKLLADIQKDRQALVNTTQNRINTESLVKTVGGVASLARGIAQTGQIVKTFFNDNLTAGEKFTQIITGLSFAIPMLTKGFQQAKEAAVTFFGVSQAMAGPVIIAITAIIAIFTAISEYQKQIYQNEIKAYDAAIETNRAIRQEAESYEGLYDALEKLNEQQQDHIMTRHQLRTKIEELINEYGLEGEAAEKLRKN